MAREYEYFGMIISGLIPLGKDGETCDQLSAIAKHQGFEMRVITKPSYGSADIELHPTVIHITIGLVYLLDEHKLRIEFKTHGKLPPGIKHGTFNAIFRDGHRCETFLSAMYDQSTNPEQKKR